MHYIRINRSRTDLITETQMDLVKRRRLEIENERRREAKESAKNGGSEVLTPRAAVHLFGKSAEAVHKALQNDRIFALFDLWFTERRTPLISLSSAVAYWGEPDDQLLDEMRRNGMTLSDGPVIFNVLHPRPLATLRDQSELE